MKRVLTLTTILIVAFLYLAAVPLASAGMGQALYERWDDGGTADSMLTETSPPDYTEILTSTEWGIGDDSSIENYRGRITAWLIPTVTGNYIFSLVSDDAGFLWLSTDHDPANARQIALESAWAYEDAWPEAGDEARSAAIPLQAGKAYWLRGGYAEGAADDHIRIAWESAAAGIPAHTIITEKYISDIDPFYASFPTPADGKVNVKVENVQLSWQVPALLPDSPYKVYFGADPNFEPPLFVEDLAEPTVNVGNLQTSTSYVWRVDVFDPNEGGNPAYNEGPLWTFTTTPARPVIFTQPQHSLVYADETAVFTIEAYSANSVPFSYAWFKETDPAVILSDTDTLEITDAQLDDEGMYKCKLTNSFGQVTSDPARLIIKRAIGHWPFDSNLQDVVAGNNATYTGGGQVAYDAGVPNLDGSALVFIGQENRAVTVPSVAVTTDFWSIAFWDFSPPDILNDGYMIASGSPEGFEDLMMRRWEDSWIGGLNRYVGAVGGIINEWDSEAAFGYLGPYERDTWHHHVMTYDPIAGVAKWYIDGALAGEYDAAEFTAFEPDIYVGDSEGGGRPFEGLIDDLYIYNYPLNPIEVAVAYTDVTEGEVCMEYPENDFNQDCRIDILDLELLVQEWLDCIRYPSDRCF